MKYVTLTEKADEKTDLGDTDKACILLNEGLSLAKQERETSYVEFFLGKLENIKKDYKSGLFHLERAIRYEPNNLQFLVNLGDTYKLLKNEEEAIKAFDKALKINPKDFNSLYRKGVLLSEFGNKDEAIKLFDKALKIKPDNYNSLRNKGVLLSESGNEVEAIKAFDRALEINPKDYDSLRSKGVSLSKLENEEEAIKAFDKALEINPEDYNSLRNKGVSLRELGYEEEAIKFFDGALAINFNDYDSLRSKGISLSKLGHEEEAIRAFDKALEINPKDYDSLYIKGILLSKLGHEKEAIKAFDRALEIKPEDYNSLHSKGVSLSVFGHKWAAIKAFDRALETKPKDYDSLYNKGILFSNLGNEKEAIKLFDRALQIKPDDLNTLIGKSFALEKLERYNDAKIIIEHLKNNIELKDKEDFVHFKSNYLKTKTESETPEEVGKNSDILNTVIGEFQDKKDDFFNSMNEIESDFKRFTDTKRSIPDGFPSFLSILRKWNSYTPIIPSEKGDNKGGGYFLYHKGKGIVIDPGFNFIENFYQEGFKVADIDAVLITHAHNDHTVDLESIITLVYKHNDAKKHKKTIDLFLNVGTFMKYSGWLNLKDSSEINNITVLQPETSYNLSNDYDGIIIHTVKAQHNEIVSNKYAIGVIFDIKDTVKLGFTGDTGWDFKNEGRIARVFADHETKLLVAHLGSIKKSEFNYPGAKNDYEINKCFYEQHLGILGITKFVDAVKPELTIISEFGEELRDYRIEIVKVIGKVLKLKCLPGDIGLHIRLSDLGVHCFVNNDFVSYDDINPLLRDANILYHRDENIQTITDALDRKQKEKAIPLSERTNNWMRTTN